MAVTILPADQRPTSRTKAATTYMLRLRATSERDEHVRSLRRLLKYALRQCGLRAISVHERRDCPGTRHEAAARSVRFLAGRARPACRARRPTTGSLPLRQRRRKDRIAGWAALAELRCAHCGRHRGWLPAPRTNSSPRPSEILADRRADQHSARQRGGCAMTPRLAEIVPRLKALLLMLSSDRDGEVVAAGRAVGRAVKRRRRLARPGGPLGAGRQTNRAHPRNANSNETPTGVRCAISA